MKTVLFFSHSAEFYGADKILFAMIKDLSGTYRIHVALPGPGRLGEELAKLKGVETYYLPMLRFTRQIADQAANLFIAIFFVWRICKLLREVRPDLVYCNTIRHVITSMLAHCFGYPVVFHSHEHNVAGLIGRMFAAIVNRSANKIIFISETTRRSYVDLCMTIAAKSVIIYNGIVPYPFPGKAGGQNQRDGETFPRLITIAKLAPHKRIADLVNAMAKLVQKYPRASLVIVGEGELYPDLAQLVAHLGLEKCVTFTGYRNDAMAFLAAADIFLAPFANEGLNLAALEAMMLGKPVVAAASGGLLEVVIDGETGFFHPLGDIAALTERISRLAGSPLLCRKLGVNGHHRALSLFNIDRQLQQVREVLAELIS